MMNRWFSLALIAIALCLGSCNSPESDSTSQDAATENVAVSSTEAEGTAAPETTNDDIANVNITPEASSSQEPSNSAQQSPTKPGEAPTAPSPATTAASAPAPTEPSETTEQADSKEQLDQTASITIDETICGAGGQEAYFETKAQEIYICKNEAEILTYIATPKKKGNSLFLPAQKVQQGDVTGYIAMDEAKTYVVTPGGFQLQDSGKVKKSEKVIRRQLSTP